MAKILDQFGDPIDTGALQEPQTSRIAQLANSFLTPMLDNLTPARLASVLRNADNGDLMSQHRLFADMEERDPHLLAEMGKRKLALLNLDWDIVPPRDASAAEKKTAAWVKEVLTDAADPFEDMLLACMDGVGHGFAATELEWRQEGTERLPAFFPRPQEWFRLTRDRRELRLRDSSADGAPLAPFGWVFHTHGKAKTGYLGRLGLYRALVWPFLYKSYAIGDFAEFLETYGLPIIVGKYFSGASAEEKSSLMRAVTALGHDARAIMPADMSLEIQKVTGGGSGGGSHLDMVSWADKAQSKAILGATLTSQADGKSSTNALGKVHEEVRRDLQQADARQVSATITRDLIYPLIALNRGGVDGLRRCPRLVFDTSEPDDLSAFADALPKLSPLFDIPVGWVQERLRIPAAQDGEEVLRAPAPQVPAAGTPPDNAPPAALAALAATPPAKVDRTDPLGTETDQLAAAAAPSWNDMIEAIRVEVEQATDLEALQRRLVDLYGGLASDDLVRVMSAAFALAELKGMDAARTVQ